MENDNGAILILTVLIVSAFLLIVFKLASFFAKFNCDTRYIISEMNRAEDYNEYRYWQRELRCHYLCLIPFVSERNVMRLYDRLYYRPKHSKNSAAAMVFLIFLLPLSSVPVFVPFACAE